MACFGEALFVTPMLTSAKVVVTSVTNTSEISRGGARGGPGPPYFGLKRKKKRIAEVRKAGRASDKERV